VEESWTKNLKAEWLRAPNYITYGPAGNPSTLNPQPSTLNPEPYTLHPTP